LRFCDRRILNQQLSAWLLASLRLVGLLRSCPYKFAGQRSAFPATLLGGSQFAIDFGDLSGIGPALKLARCDFLA
jgi:hypothetical protein